MQAAKRSGILLPMFLWVAVFVCRASVVGVAHNDGVRDFWVYVVVGVGLFVLCSTPTSAKILLLRSTLKN
jgi:hypothetical protein